MYATPSPCGPSHPPIPYVCLAVAADYDDSVPWEGTVIDFMDAILAVSPFAAFNYTYTTPMARLASPGSQWTATVYDVEKRVVDVLSKLELSQTAVRRT